MTAIDTKSWALGCESCATGSTGFGPFSAEEARQLADTHDALQHGRHPTAALLAAAEHVERTDSRSAGDSDNDEDGWF